tara:strand:+ start:126 stop:464 length:339 start_codon:yes stop_codon:yes gene_type:complete
MAFAVLAGIPWLAGIIMTAFSGIFAWFLTFMTKRFAIAAAAITLIVSLTAGLFAAVSGLLAGISLAVPPDMLTMSGILLPNNLEASFSICISTRLLKYAYDWNVKFIEMKLF